MAEKIKYAATAAFVILGFVGAYMLPHPWSGIGLVVALVVAGGIFLISDAGRRFVAYAKDSIAETRKVVWPTRKETIQTTLIVFVFVFCVAVFLLAVDKGITWALYDFILNRNA